MVKNINGLQFIAKIAARTKDLITFASGLVSPLQTLKMDIISMTR
jgi:hypothetical protein